ncbi:MAG: alanine--tRNA ligase [Pseudomonadota bacterium]
MKTAAIRKTFLDFFAEHNHTIVRSDSLVPGSDPTLLFTNSGMVQFKNVFLGQESRPFKRATSSQRCVRAGGKHNDLENVGYTARHHTFFEMLGNFSFGDYFKEDAIQFAWALMTQRFGLPKEKLWVTVYHNDDEAFDIWHKKIGLEPHRILRIGDKPGGGSDNFWQMADTGPCGPCSEIFYDHGQEIPGGLPGTPDDDGDRYIEIWNLVFMQYDRQADGTLLPLPKPSVDTGMGLERIAAILQNVHSNYEIDLFQHLIKAAAQATNTTDLNAPSLKVIADHLRASCFLIIDGVLPGNEGRSYVLRRILRRALRHGHKLGQTQPFFYKLVPALIDVMGEAYPELIQNGERIANILKQEEHRFSETLDSGMKLLSRSLEQLSDSILPGEVAFQLYDTYGFPLDLTADICREKNIHIDEAGFEAAMNRQRERARAASSFKQTERPAYKGSPTNFHGYSTTEIQCTIIAIFDANNQSVEKLSSGEAGIVILDNTPFYAESGGQVGDSGLLETSTGSFITSDTQKVGDSFGHYGHMERGELQVGTTLSATINHARRKAITRHHSATHLLHAVLRKILGEHVQQKGSLVDSERLRFDFSHPAPLTSQEITHIEKEVNAAILANHTIQTPTMTYNEAIQAGAMALFGEKYGDEVRVVNMGTASTELCGGTHVCSTAEIGLFKILNETGIASGIRRIEAIAGDVAVEWVQNLEHTVEDISGQLKVTGSGLSNKIKQLLDENKTQEKHIQKLLSQLAGFQAKSLTTQAVEIKNGIRLLATIVEADATTLRNLVETLKSQLSQTAILLAATEGNNVRLVAGASADLKGKIHAGELVNAIAQHVGGKGGGRPDFAQAGGTDASKLAQALKMLPAWIEERA